MVRDGRKMRSFYHADCFSGGLRGPVHSGSTRIQCPDSLCLDLMLELHQMHPVHGMAVIKHALRQIVSETALSWSA